MNGTDLTRIVGSWGTSLTETRGMLGEFFDALKEQKDSFTQAGRQISEVKFFTPEEVRQLGLTTETGEPFTLETGWLLKLTPGANGAEPTMSFVTPSDFLTDIEAGQWEITQDQAYISPSGRRYSPEEVQAQLPEPELVIPPEFEEAFYEAFPGTTARALQGTIEYISQSDENLQSFLQTVRTAGFSSATQGLLETLFPENAKEVISAVFPESIPVTETTLKQWEETPWLAPPAEWSEVVEGFPGLMDIMEWLAPTKVGAALGVAGAYMETYISRPFEAIILDARARFQIAIGQGTELDRLLLQQLEDVQKRYGYWGGLVAPDISTIWNDYVEQQGGPSKFALEFSEWVNPVYIIPIGATFGQVAKLTTRIPILGNTMRYAAGGIQAIERGIFYPITAPTEAMLRGLERVGTNLGENMVNRLISRTENLLLEIPATDAVIKGVVVDNWIKKTLQISAKIPFIRTGIEKGLGWRVLVGRESKLLEDIVGRGAVAYAEFQKMGLNAARWKVGELLAIDANPIKLFGFNKSGFSEKMLKQLLPEYSEKATTAGTLEHIFTHPEMYNLTEKQLLYVTRVNEINRAVLELLRKEGVAPENVIQDWIHRVVTGKTTAGGEIITERARGLGGRRIGATPSYEKPRTFATMAEGIQHGIQYDPDITHSVATYIQEAFNKIASNRFEIYTVAFGQTPLERLAERFPSVAERALLTKTELADAAYFNSVINRAIRGEKIPAITLDAVERRFPDLGRRLRNLVQGGGQAENQFREILARNEKIISDLGARLKQAQAAAAKGERVITPGAKPEIKIEIPDEAKLKEAFITMEYEDKLAFRSTMTGQLEDAARVVGEQRAELAGLQETLATDSLATLRFEIGGESVDITSFISIREQSFPEYFTVKQARAIKPFGNFTQYTQKGTRLYNRVPKDAVLDELADKLGMSIDEIGDRAMAIRFERQTISDLKELIVMADDRLKSVKRTLRILDDVDIRPNNLPVPEPITAQTTQVGPEITRPAMPVSAQEEIFAQAGVGKPGLSTETIGLVYRNEAGEPIVVVTLNATPEGVRIGAVVSRAPNLRATRAIIEELRRIKAVLPEETEMSQQGYEIAQKYRKLVGQPSVESELTSWEKFRTEKQAELANLTGEARTAAEEELRTINFTLSELQKRPIIPKAEAGMPEAGLQQDFFGYQKPVFPRGKGEITQISMEDYSKLAELSKKEGILVPDTAIKPQVEGIPELEGPALAARVKYTLPPVKEIAQRQAELTALRNEVKTILESRKAPYWQTRAARARVMEIVRQPGIGEGYIMHPFAGGKIYNQDFIDAFNKFFGHDTGSGSLRVISDVAGILRITKASLDFSAMAIQGLTSFGLAHAYMLQNPVVGLKLMGRWYQALGYSIGSFFNPEIFWRFLSKESAVVGQRVSFGGTLRAVDYFTTLETTTGVGGFANKVLSNIPLKPFQRAEISFYAAGEVVRDEFWKILSPKAIMAGRGFELARELDLFTGIFESRVAGVPLTIRQLESAFGWFAPNYTRACLTILADMFRGGYTGGMARKALGGMIAAGAMYYAGIQFGLSSLAGKSSEEAWQDVMNGFCVYEDPITHEINWKPSARFMTIKVENYSLGIGGFWYGLLRLAGNITDTITNDNEVVDFATMLKTGKGSWYAPFLNWWYNRSSPLTGIGFDLASGKNFLGYPIETPSDYAKYVLTRFEPIWMEQGLNWLIPGWSKDNEIPEGVAKTLIAPAELFGMRTFPESAWVNFYDKVNEYIQQIPKEELDPKQIEAWQKGELTWAQLTLFQKQNLLSRYPDLLELYEGAQADSGVKQSKDWEAYTNRIEEERAIYLKRIDDLTQQLLRGEIDTKTYREKVSEAGQNYGAILESIQRDPSYAEIYEYFEQREAQGSDYNFTDDIALTEYETTILYADLVDEKGDYDWDERDRRIDAFIAKWGEDKYNQIIQYLAQEKRETGVSEVWIKRSLDMQALGRGYWHLPYKPIYQMDLLDEANGDIPARYYADWKTYQALTTDAEKEAFLASHPELTKDWRTEYRQANPEADARLALWGYGGKLQSMEAYNLVMKWAQELGIPIDSIGLGLPPQSLIEDYFDYGKLATQFSGNSAEAKLWRLEHPDFTNWAMENWGWEGTEDYKGIEYYQLEVKWDEQDTQYDGFGQRDSEFYIANEDAREKAREDFLANNPEYERSIYYRKAMDMEFPEDLIDTYVDWYANPPTKADDRWFGNHPNESFYGDDWWLLEHKEFYQAMISPEIMGENAWQPRDFSKVPTQEVFGLYQQYLDLPVGQDRLDFREKHPELDNWLVLAKGLKPVGDRGNPEAETTPWEEQANVEQFQGLFD